MYFGEIWNFHNFKCSNISAFISFHNEKNYIFGISITCRFQKKYFQPPLNFFIFHHPLRRLFRWLSDTYMKKKLYICDQHPLRVSLNFFQKFFFQSPSPLKFWPILHGWWPICQRQIHAENLKKISKALNCYHPRGFLIFESWEID